MLRVGLTGGIGAGKSAVSELLAARGALIVDADAAAREVVARGTPGLAAVVEAFGPGVLRPDGELDRPAVAAIVFDDPEALAKLNSIVHPLVGERMNAIAASAGPDDVVVYDIPLLAENQLTRAYDLVVVVDVPVEVALDRLVQQRGMPEDDVRARMSHQASREERRAIADVVIDNSGDRAALEEQVDRLWADLRTRASRG